MASSAPVESISLPSVWAKVARQTPPFFREEFYLQANPDVAHAIANDIFRSGWQHFILHGADEGRSPNPSFKPDFYLSNNPDVAAAIPQYFGSAFEHFWAYGFSEGREASGPDRRRVVVLLVDLTDLQASSNITLDDLNAIMQFTAERFQGISFGRTILEGEAFGPFSIDQSKVGCDRFAWADAVDAAAMAVGIDIASYQHRVYVLGRDLGCFWRGIATTVSFVARTSTPHRVWLAGIRSPSVLPHELLHNFGLGHAGTDRDNNGSFDSYANDFSDIMSVFFGPGRMLNGAHMALVGFYKTWPPVDRASVSGVYKITTMSSLGRDNLPRVIEFDNGHLRKYYLSYRQPVGLDSALFPEFTSGLSLHYLTGNGVASSAWVTTLSDGEFFEDQRRGWRITQVSHDANSVTVNIELF